MSACGGGGSSTPPPAGSQFTLVASPASLTVVIGSSNSVTLSATAYGLPLNVDVQIAGMPAGVSVSPSSLTLSAGAAQVVTFFAAATAATSTGTLTFTGTAGSATSTAQVAVAVSNDTINANTPPTRTRYVRTDATTEYPFSGDPQWIMYNPNTSQFFVSDPQSNRITVMDDATQEQVASISVPGAYGIDDTPDHSTLYVGTQIGDLYAIDTASLTVTQRYISSQIGPNGFTALRVAVLSNGDLALLGSPGQDSAAGTTPGVGVWNPTTNSLSVYTTSYGATQLPQGLTSTIICGTNGGDFAGFARTVDRTEIILEGQNLCELNPTTGQSIYVAATGATPAIVTSPDGNYVAQLAYPGVVLYDSKTLNQVTSFPVNDQALSSSALLFSADSTTLFITTDGIVYVYSLATQQQVGWIPNIFIPLITGGGSIGPIDSPNLQAVDATGLLAGPMEEGVGFIDSTVMNTGPVGTLYDNVYLTPAAGPISGGTQVELSGPTTTLDKSQIYVGSQTAIFDSIMGDNFTVTTPEGAPGAADVYVHATDGGVEIGPEGFSYGPTILEVTPNASTAEGGGTGIVYGYGFGPTSATSTPPDLQVTVGGKAAVITFFNPNAYGLSSPPFLLESISYTIPAGAVGSASVTVSNNIGTANQAGAMTYLPATQQFPLAGAQLAQGIYDPYNAQYYFTDANQVQVFSLAQGSWLSPIPIPALAGTTQRLWGIALSPDGSHLAISDVMAGVIYTLNPSTPSTVSTYSIKSTNPAGIVTNPSGLAISDAGIVYFTVVVSGGDGFDSFFKLDTSTGTVTDYGITGPGGPLDSNLRIVIGSDNSRVYFNSDGYVYAIATATDKIAYQRLIQVGDYDMSLAANQQQLEATSYFFDADLDPESFYAMNDREALNVTYVYGAKLDAAGSLEFQPATNGIDVLDGRLGNLLTRIALPLPLSTNYDALVNNGTDNTLIAIAGATGNGIAVLNLNSIAAPVPLPCAKKSPTRDQPLGQPLTSSKPGAHPDARQRTTPYHTIPHLSRPNFPPARARDPRQPSTTNGRTSVTIAQADLDYKRANALTFGHELFDAAA